MHNRGPHRRAASPPGSAARKSRGLTLETERLRLRPWRDDDLAPLAVINADPAVMEFYLAPLTPEQSAAAVGRYRAALARDGFGFTAAELKSSGRLIGIIGMQTMSFAIPGLSQPAVEIGWRIGTDYWGQGLATEGARALVHHGLKTLGLPRLVAITAAVNVRSRRVMEKVGMSHLTALDFDHPIFPAGHPLRKHVLYQISRQPS